MWGSLVLVGVDMADTRDNLKMTAKNTKRLRGLKKALTIKNGLGSSASQNSIGNDALAMGLTHLEDKLLSQK